MYLIVSHIVVHRRVNTALDVLLLKYYSPKQSEGHRLPKAGIVEALYVLMNNKVIIFLYCAEG